jgi:hypothetical protein
VTRIIGKPNPDVVRRICESIIATLPDEYWRKVAAERARAAGAGDGGSMPPHLVVAPEHTQAAGEMVP